MLSNKSRNFLFFLLGITAGVLGVFGYQELVKNSVQEPEETIVFRENEPYLVKPAKNQGKVKRRESVEAKDVTKEKKEEEKGKALENDTVLTVELALDSLLDTLDAIVVRSDKLLAVKDIPLEYIKKDKEDSETNSIKADSLLADKLNIKPNPKPEKVRVEVWSSPIHFRGYKFGGGKLVIYGMEADALVKVYKIADTYFLKTVVTVYRLSVTDEFKKLIMAD